jgi:hypothetical protein
MLCFRYAFFALNEWGEVLSKQSLTAHVSQVTPTTCFCTELFSINLNFFFIPGVIKIPTEILLRIQLVLKGSGVADEKTKYSFYYFHNWKFAHQKMTFFASKTPQ